MTGLAGNLAGKLSGGGGALTFASWAAQTKAGLDTIEADSALHGWLPEFDVTTFNGSNISGIEDLWGSSDMAQGSAPVQPPWLATGGAGGHPAIDLGVATSRRLVATLPGYAAGNRICMYVVAVGAVSGGTIATLDSPADAVLFYTNATDKALYVDYNTGATFNAAIQTLDNQAHILALRPLASGSLSQVDGVTTSPNPTGDALVEINRATFGYPPGVSFCGGVVSGLFLINNATAAKDTYFRSQLALWFGAFPQ